MSKPVAYGEGVPVTAFPRTALYRFSGSVIVQAAARKTYFPRWDIPPLDLVDIRCGVRPALGALPDTRVPLISPNQAAYYTVTLVNERNEMLISRLPILSVAFRTSPIPGRSSQRYKVFNLRGVDLSRSYIELNVRAPIPVGPLAIPFWFNYGS